MTNYIGMNGMDRWRENQRQKLSGITSYISGTAPIDMRLPTPSKWQPSDSRTHRTTDEHVSETKSIHGRLKALNGFKRNGRMHAAAIRDALQSTDRNLPDYLRRLTAQGYLKRERLGNHFVYSLQDPTPNMRKEARAKAKKARIAKLKREIAKKMTALRKLEA